MIMLWESLVQHIPVCVCVQNVSEIQARNTWWFYEERMLLGLGMQKLTLVSWYMSVSVCTHTDIAEVTIFPTSKVTRSKHWISFHWCLAVYPMPRTWVPKMERSYCLPNWWSVWCWRIHRGQLRPPWEYPSLLLQLWCWESLWSPEICSSSRPTTRHSATPGSVH